MIKFSCLNTTEAVQFLWWQKYDKSTHSAFRFWRPAWKLGNSIDTKFQGSEPEWPLWAVGAICTARPLEVSPPTALWGLWCLNDNSGVNSSSPSRKWNDYQIHIINMTVRCVYCTCRLYCPIPPSTSTQYIQYTLHNNKASTYETWSLFLLVHYCLGSGQSKYPPRIHSFPATSPRSNMTLLNPEHPNPSDWAPTLQAAMPRDAPGPKLAGKGNCKTLRMEKRVGRSKSISLPTIPDSFMLSL